MPIALLPQVAPLNGALSSFQNPELAGRRRLVFKKYFPRTIALATGTGDHA
jgi:hypothetical protein